MKSLLLIIVSCKVFSYALPIFPQIERGTEEEMKLAEKYLNSTYPQPNPRTYLGSEDNIISAAETEQKKKFCGVTNQLYPNTLAVMKRPGDGVPNIGAFSHFPGSPKWNKTHLTYSFRNYTPDMSVAAVHEGTAICLSLWSNVTPLKFTRVEKNGDLVFIFYDREHRTPFPEFVIAYAYGPGEGLGGDIFLNDLVKWTMDNHKTFTGAETNFIIALCHELGHSLGLGHSTVEGSVMKDEYMPGSYIYEKPQDCRTVKLHSDDIAGIQALYGPNPASSPVH